MNAMVPVPVWVVLTFAVVGIVWCICDTIRVKAWRDLWELYLKQTRE